MAVWMQKFPQRLITQNLCCCANILFFRKGLLLNKKVFFCFGLCVKCSNLMELCKVLTKAFFKKKFFLLRMKYFFKIHNSNNLLNQLTKFGLVFVEQSRTREAIIKRFKIFSEITSKHPSLTYKLPKLFVALSWSTKFKVFSCSQFSLCFLPLTSGKLEKIGQRALFSSKLYYWQMPMIWTWCGNNKSYEWQRNQYSPFLLVRFLLPLLKLITTFF